MTATRGGYAVIWRFEVAPERAAEFELRYGPSGDWARLFSRSPGYRGTALLKDRANPLVYVTVDRWESEAAFTSFQERNAETYAQLDASSEALTRAEARLGSFTELP